MIEALWLLISTRWLRPLRSRKAIEAAQAKGFARLRQKVMPKSPLYATYADRPLSLWPQMNKARMMAEFTQINTAGMTKEKALQVALQSEASRDFSPMIGDVAVGLSTGTSGQRGLFASNKRERRIWAALMVGRFMPRLWQRQRVAFFLRANNALYETVSNPLIQFSFYDLLEGVEAHIPPLQAQNPTLLIAPAQVLARLAEAQLSGGLHLSPKVVISVAEVLSPEDQALIERAFQTRVDQIYQCTEGVLGMTCRHGSLHLNEGHIHIARDVVDEETGAFCPILTDLARETLPILNYRLDDVLVPDPRPCPCGSATLRLARIEGRADDMLYWQGIEGGQRYIPADVLRQVIATAGSAIQDYRIHQTGQELLEVWLAAPDFPTAATEVEAGLIALAARMKARIPQIKIAQGLPPQTGAKLRRITAQPSS